MAIIASGPQAGRTPAATPGVPMPQQSSEVGRRIFTFTKSGWIMRAVAADVCLSVLMAVVVWLRLVMPILPSQTWIRYTLTVFGLPVLYVVFEFILGALVSGPLSTWMKRYDEPVVAKSSGREESRLPPAPV